MKTNFTLYNRILKFNSTLLALVCLFCFFLLSCKKQSRKGETQIHLTTKTFNHDALKSIGLRLNDKLLFQHATTGSTGYNTNDTEIREIISPLTESGESLYTEIISQLENTPEWNNLSYEDQQAILNFDEVQKGELGFVFSVLPDNIEPQAINPDVAHVIGCISSGLGLSSIYEIVYASPKALMTATEVIKIVKIIGRRYALGWFSLALSIVGIIDCIT